MQEDSDSDEDDLVDTSENLLYNHLYFIIII